MSLRYTIEQLLRLRSSPLACKPENFPPLEEWMGSTNPDERQRGCAQPRGKPDDQTLQNETLQPQRRPTLLETHSAGKKSSTVPADIVLGPPKTAFASANSRNSLKSLSGETSEETNKRFPAHERVLKDHELAEEERRDTRYNGTNKRRPGRDDKDSWHTSRRRHHDEEQGDGGHGRNGDRDKGRWDREQDGGGDPKRLSREAGRREGRGKFEQPWFRNDKAQGAEGGNRLSTKQHEWRKERGLGRGSELDRSMKAEQDPEWMDSSLPAESKQVHTQEDFQRWKESMKASEESGRDERQGMAKQPETKRPETKQPEPPPMPAFLDSSTVDFGMDKFFAAFGDGQVSSEQKAPEVKAQRKPRFAALFSPQAEGNPKPSSNTEFMESNQAPCMGRPQSKSAPVDENKADQEHFQRVLQMLAGRGSNSRPPSAGFSQPPNHSDRADAMTSRHEAASQPAELSSSRDLVDPPEHRPQDRGSEGASEPLVGGLVEPRQQTPRQPMQKHDADLLLRLMQQSGMEAESKPPQPLPAEPPRSAPGISSLQSMVPQKTSTNRPHNVMPLVVDNPGMSKMQGPEPTLSGAGQQRQLTNGPNAALYDDSFSLNLRQANQNSTSNLGSEIPARGASHLPLGMPRPPGFDQLVGPPPPGWQNQLQRPPREQTLPPAMNPPPGMLNPGAHAMNTHFAPGPSLPPPTSSHMMPPLLASQPPQHPPLPPHPNQHPHHHQLPRPPQPPLSLQQRQPKYARAEGGPGFVPGMGPLPAPGPPSGPPGFINTTLPAPGYPNMTPSARGVGGSTAPSLPPPHQQPQQLQQPPPPPQFLDGNSRMLPRHVMDMLASGGQQG